MAPIRMIYIYLKDSTGRFQDDMDRARRQGYHFAAKLVRGKTAVQRRRNGRADHPRMPHIYIKE
jgi:hypothetical protein